jgi:hypothetical protein
MLGKQRADQHPNRRFCVAMVPTLEAEPSVLDSVSASYCLFLAINLIEGTVVGWEVIPG